MTDGASISAALSGAKTAYELVKMIRESGTSLKTAELQLRLADVIGALSEVRVQLADVQGELATRNTRIAELEKALEDKTSVVRVNDAYYRVGADGRHHGAPYCMRCWEEDNRLRSLADAGIGGHTLCPVCNTPYSEARTGTFP